MVTEDFCFPTIANNQLAHLNITSNPSLWRIPSQSERHKWRRKSLSELERKQSRRQDETVGVGGGIEEDPEKMDMLWEDFNEELHAGNLETDCESSCSDSQRPPDFNRSPASISNSKRAETSISSRGGGPTSPFLIVKMLKKLLMLRNSAALKRHASYHCPDH